MRAGGKHGKTGRTEQKSNGQAAVEQDYLPFKTAGCHARTDTHHDEVDDNRQQQIDRQHLFVKTMVAISERALSLSVLVAMPFRK